MTEIVNKVAESGIITLDLSLYLPAPSALSKFDLLPFLYREMILKEKEYRSLLAEHNWAPYSGKSIALYCSSDAIIPVWAYMLATSYLQQAGATSIVQGTMDDLKKHLTVQRIIALPLEDYTDKRVVLRGCGDIEVPDYAYTAATAHLRPVVKSLMYGEPCSTVPVYKAPKAAL
ncbi:MAG: DUF2480 family protein [Chitinophagia bacterium]|nr:DUF2480 family protein [Chitinophagia bacterium]